MFTPQLSFLLFEYTYFLHGCLKKKLHGYSIPCFSLSAMGGVLVLGTESVYSQSVSSLSANDSRGILMAIVSSGSGNRPMLTR